MLQCGRHLSNYATVRGDIMEHFITSVHINEVRHLKDIEIKLNPEKRQHLILTGKNGSGKNSVLQIPFILGGQEPLKWLEEIMKEPQTKLKKFRLKMP